MRSLLSGIHMRNDSIRQRKGEWFVTYPGHIHPVVACSDHFGLFLGVIASNSFWNVLLVITSLVLSKMILSRETLGPLSQTFRPGAIEISNFMLRFVMSCDIGLATEKSSRLPVFSQAVRVITGQFALDGEPARRIRATRHIGTGMALNKKM